LVEKEKAMWKGILMLFAIGAGPTDPQILQTGWGQTYGPPQYTISEQAYAICKHDVDAKADELNQVYATAGEPGRWVSACVPVK
jgi:hypothetical protein